MANLTAAIQRIRRTRRRLEASPSRDFERYRPEYETILEATVELAGDPAFDDLHAWMIETTKERNRLPTPDEVRAHAREVCAAHDVTVPQESSLRD